ncbi:MAG: hypothetical protein AAB914_00855 [Patescibacteria group bacterium]
MSKQITTAVWGTAPWSSELLTLDGDVGRGRASADARDSLVDKEQELFYELLNSQAITTHNNGQLSWPDYLRPIAKLADGFEGDPDTGSVTRWFDTNTFYRQPVISGELSLRDELAWSALIAGELSDNYELTLLSPFAFSELSGSRGTDPQEKLQHVVGLYSQLFGQLESAGVGKVLLFEPYAPYHQVGVFGAEVLSKTIDQLAEEHPSIDISLYLGYGDPSDIARVLAENKFLDGIGWDIAKTNGQFTVPELSQKRFIAGLVDSSNTHIDQDSGLVDMAEDLVVQINSEEITLTHSVELEHVPPAYAYKKVEQLGRLASNFAQGGTK